MQDGTDENGNPIYVENNIALTPTQIYNFWNNGGFLSDEAFLVDKSYVKLRSIVLGWELPKKWLAKTPLQGVKISFFGNNLFVWTHKGNRYVDPETTTTGTDLAGNFGELYSNPSCRVYGLNLTIKY